MEYYYCPRLLKFLQYLWVSVLWNVTVLPELAVSTAFRNPWECSYVLKAFLSSSFLSSNMKLGIYFG